MERYYILAFFDLFKSIQTDKRGRGINAVYLCIIVFLSFRHLLIVYTFVLINHLFTNLFLIRCHCINFRAINLLSLIDHRYIFPGDVNLKFSFLIFVLWEKTLNRDHGYPLRGIVPGVIGARSVKWLDSINIIAEECQVTNFLVNSPKMIGPTL